MALFLVLGTVFGSGGCGDERAVVLDLSVHTSGDRLCVLAFGAGQGVFAQGYGGTDGPPPVTGTLAFLAGDTVSDSLRLTARLAAGGAVVAGATGEAAFADAGGSTLRLDVRRCQPRPRRLDAPTLRTLTRLDMLGTTPRLAAIDVDGDGRDELVGPASGGMLPRVDVSGVEATVTRVATDLANGEALRFLGDLDGDCALDAAALTRLGARVALEAASGRVEGPALAPADALDVAAGGFGPMGRAALVTAGPTGVIIVPWRGDAATSTLDAAAAVSVAVGDLSGDGRADLVASGVAGAKVWLGSATGLTPATGALPTGFTAVTGPIAIGDVDGEGTLDVVGAAADMILVARNRGDGLLEDRTPAGLAPTAGPIAQLLVADLDGDCRDDVATIDERGAVRVLLSIAPPALEPATAMFPACAAFVAADVDGDGARELVMLSLAGEVVLWGP